MDPSFVDDYHATQNLDYTIRHGRRAGDPISKTAEKDREKRRGFYRLLTGKYPTHRKFIR